ncbi:phage baseplate plug family protein [Serratia fonticola]|uniref:Cyanophage baseplate Pam3 plug gp18 domain-containing protein n=1 Tax=Serratia fonticola TaxID=47917 RepID=A0AAW3WK78_SERFO|nr:hypothetical protein [Serratia fonticola]MBC3211370.1 hypothetical protein [Serratia fonticola]NYA12352.1 hypothetical protein [Serratia fonticola]NYA31931.1 hypothetical protein [Serratia fonticola]
MEQLIQLEKLPNQTLTIRLGDHRYEIKIQSISDELMCVSIIRDNQMLIQGQRCIPFSAILPDHKEIGLGNFMFTTVSDEYPNYQKFGSDHQLYYYAPEEV